MALPAAPLACPAEPVVVPALALNRSPPWPPEAALSPRLQLEIAAPQASPRAAKRGPVGRRGNRTPGMNPLVSLLVQKKLRSLAHPPELEARHRRRLLSDCKRGEGLATDLPLKFYVARWGTSAGV